jgi:hypothetical protein
MKKMGWFVGGLLFAACLWAQSIPPGWKIAKGGFTPFPGQDVAAAPDSCQIAVPPDWRPSKLVAGEMEAPGSQHLYAIVSANIPGKSFAELVTTAKDVDQSMHIQGKTVVEDSAKRYWTASKDGDSTRWIVIVPGSPVCHAEIEFRNAASEAAARKIALSLGAAKGPHNATSNRR